MNARRWLSVLLLVPLLLAAQTTDVPDVLALLRTGNAAFERGAYAEAGALFERAGERTTEPGLAAFNLATAKYNLAKDGNSQALADAEQAYRCCLEQGEVRRARALFGLGNCQMLRAAGSSLDRSAIRWAIDRFGECLRDPTCDAELAADARHNRLRARLLLLQAPPSPDGSDDDSGKEESKDDSPRDGKQASPRYTDGPEGKGEKSATPGKGGAEKELTDHQGLPAPGRGTLPPVPDRPDATPLSANEAVEHLEIATRLILEESRQHRRARARQPASGVRDW
jgi:tetratricopeptide (TPR) repeat protein